MSGKRILILFAHPAFQRSRANRWLVDVAQNMEGMTFRDLYELYPDFNIDVAYEQQLLLSHDVIVFHHPFYWYSCPALLKEWQDLVLMYGFAYGEGGTALQNKWLLTAITTGGHREAYLPQGHNRFEIIDLLRPFEQTAHLCGMVYLPPFVVHNAHQHSDAEWHIYMAHYQAVLMGLRDGKWQQRDFSEMVYLNDGVEGNPHA